MDLAELARLGDLNLARSWATLAGPGGTVGGSERCSFVATGVPAAFFNGAHAVARVDDPDAVVSDAIGFFAELDLPWLLWVRVGVDDALLEAGRRAGLADAGGPPAMVLPSVADVPDVPAGTSVEVIDDDAGLIVFRDLAARGFEMPLEIVEVITPTSLLAEPSVAMIVVSADDEPVSCALVSVTGTTAGVYNVATPPEHRHRGHGTAATWAAVAAGAQRGADHSSLQASESGATVYRSMGYVEVGHYVQLIGPPGTTPA